MNHAIAKVCAAINADDAGVRLDADEMREVIEALDERERAIGRDRTRADAADADRDALRAEVGRLRAIYEAADEFLFCDYAAEVESYSETSSGSHAAAEVRASEAWNALVRLRDAERELRLATLPACASAPAGVVAAEAATRAALDGAPVDVVLVVDALRAENARLRAIVEGRTTAPTRDEVDVHFAAGGRWILRWSDGTFGTARGPCAVADASEPGILTAVRWWPLDRDGRPCAWPVTP